MEKEGSATVDRPENIPAETASGGLRILHMNWDDRTRKLRRAMHERLRRDAVLSYGRVQEEYAKNVILDILENPDDVQTHLRRLCRVPQPTVLKSDFFCLDIPRP
jgi:hypothetical protein